MTRVAYIVPGAPAAGMGAFMPGLTLNGVTPRAGLAFQNVRVGFPGTRPVEIDANHDISPLGWDPKTQPSNVSPDEITPDLYWGGRGQMGPWAPQSAAAVRGIGDNVLPVPTLDYGRQPMVAAVPGKIGGSQSVEWPAVTPTWGGQVGGGP
jgi:hypothetical protein